MELKESAPNYSNDSTPKQSLNRIRLPFSEVRARLESLSAKQAEEKLKEKEGDKQ